MEDAKTIRFITPDYKELFRVEDGGLKLLNCDGWDNV